MLKNQLISVITTANGMPIDSCYKNFINKFNKNELLRIDYNSKKLILNTLDTNYVVYKLPITLESQCFVQYIFEEWRMINEQRSNNSTNIKIFKNLKNIKNFTNHEQEVIYCLLSGYIQDKEIINYLSCCNLNSIPCVKYIVKTLYDKFETNSRTSLIQSLKAHDLDKYIPKTLIAPGIYDSFNILNNELTHTNIDAYSFKKRKTDVKKSAGLFSINLSQ